MKHALAVLVLVLGTGLLCFAANADEEKAATEASQQWLQVVDNSKYAESWDQAAEVFHAGITKENWISALNQVRTPLGKMKSRALKSAKYTTTLPGAPAGEYVVIQFDTSFDGLSPAVETVIPTKEKDGKWRVSSYFIKPAGN